MQPRPTDHELIEAVREFLESELSPALSEPRLKYRLLVAINTLSVVERELQLAEPLLQAEFSSLSELLEVQLQMPDSLEQLRRSVSDLNLKLCQRIRAGQTPANCWAVLHQIAVNNQRISNPRTRSTSETKPER